MSKLHRHERSEIYPKMCEIRITENILDKPKCPQDTLKGFIVAVARSFQNDSFGILFFLMVEKVFFRISQLNSV